MSSEEHHALISLPSTRTDLPASLNSDSLALGAALGAAALGAVALVRIFRGFRTRDVGATGRTDVTDMTKGPPISYRYESYSYTRVEIVETT